MDYYYWQLLNPVHDNNFTNIIEYLIFHLCLRCKKDVKENELEIITNSDSIT